MFPLNSRSFPFTKVYSKNFHVISSSSRNFFRRKFLPQKHGLGPINGRGGSGANRKLAEMLRIPKKEEGEKERKVIG